MNEIPSQTSREDGPEYVAEDSVSDEKLLKNAAEIFSHPGGTVGWLEELCNDTEAMEETRRRVAERDKKEARKFAHALSRLAGLPEESPLEHELNKWADDGRITDDEFFEVLKKLAAITNLMDEKGELTDEQTLEFVRTAEVEPLVEAMRCDLPPEQFLEMMKTHGEGKLAEAIRQYRLSAQGSGEAQ